MGFRYWYEGILLVSMFGFVVGLPCFFVAFWGSKMINEMGNFPTKAAKIQVGVIWKLLIVEIFSFMLLVVFLRIFS